MRTLYLPAAALNRVYISCLSAPQRVQIYFGGASSGKSCFLATRVLLDTLSGRNTLVVRQVAKTLRGSCWNEIGKAAARLGLTSLFRFSKTDMSVTAKNCGSQILFCGLDDVEKIKSITPARGVLTDIWMEEATECAWADYKQLQKRLRGACRHPKRVTLSFNPVYKTHWIYREFFTRWDEGKTKLETPDLLILKTTYRDNAFLIADDVHALESEPDPYFKSVYTEGNWGVPGHCIFRNWHQADLRQREQSEDTFLYGLDFGFAADPCAAVKASFDRGRKTVFIYAELYARGLTNDALAEQLRLFSGSHYIVCDSAEPKSIEELRRHGIPALAARKGPDSVMHAIQWLQGMEIIVDVRCPQMIRELSLYHWDADKDGNALRRPADRDNHLLDALRYALEGETTARYATAVERSGVFSPLAGA